ncbi:pyridoxamine 5'-phosphate oxidase family protein [Lysinibacillus sp. 54212]|uniref:pyridoxamine 5'-phosphate oxidase family protein n=1 Tax=Lysinibacillus sp. 54212 TaxID=3119829 RepID=UPI002FC66537
METVKKEILEVINNSHIGTMATVHNGKPFSRYMTFTNKEFTLYTVTDKHSDKVEELLENPYTHILLGYENKGRGDAFVEIEGKVTDFDDEALKLKFIEFFKGLLYKNQDEMVILQIDPIRMRLMNKKGEPPKELEFPLE